MCWEEYRNGRDLWVNKLPKNLEATCKFWAVVGPAVCSVLCGMIHILVYKVNINKSVPLQAWTGPEGFRKLRFPDYVTTAQDGGKVVSLTHRPPLPPGNAPGTHFC